MLLKSCTTIGVALVTGDLVVDFYLGNSEGLDKNSVNPVTSFQLGLQTDYLLISSGSYSSIATCFTRRTPVPDKLRGSYKRTKIVEYGTIGRLRLLGAALLARDYGSLNLGGGKMTV